MCHLHRNTQNSFAKFVNEMGNKRTTRNHISTAKSMFAFVVEGMPMSLRFQTLSVISFCTASHTKPKCVLAGKSFWLHAQIHLIGHPHYGIINAFVNFIFCNWKIPHTSYNITDWLIWLRKLVVMNVALTRTVWLCKNQSVLSYATVFSYILVHEMQM